MNNRDKLIQFFNDQFEWAKEYYENNDDYIDGYDHVLLDTIDYDKANAIIERSDIAKSEVDTYLKQHAYFERASMAYPDNALSFVNIDEIEIQISGISQDEHNCIFYELTKEMSDSEIEGCFSKSKASDECGLNDDCLYYRPDFSSIQILVDEDDMRDFFKDFKGEAA